MSYKRSNFPEQMDSFIELYDPSPSDMTGLDELVSLQKITNPSTTQTARMAELIITYRNKIINAEVINYYQDSMSNTQKFFFDTVNNYFKFSPIYDNTNPYKINNSVMGSDGNIYISLASDNAGNALSNSNFWRRITLKGDKGDSIQGIPGIGFAMPVVYNSSNPYITPLSVTFNGEIFGCISNTTISNITPSDDGINWIKLVAKGNSTVLAKIEGTITVTSVLSIIPIGIPEFNYQTDIISIQQDEKYLLKKGRDYTISANGLNILKVSGNWDGTVTPIIFDLIVLKNVVQNLSYADGTLISSGTVPLSALNADTQAQINKIGYPVLQTISQNLSGAINENTNKLANLSPSTDILIPSGTANNIVLPVTFVDKKKYSFKSSSTSTGTVTLNGITLKKLDGTVIGSGGIKPNKVYDFYYDGSASSVFILAKAEGDALVGDVLASKIFSNGDDTGLVGTMPNNGAINITPTTSSQSIPSGFTTGGTVSAVSVPVAKVLNDTTIAGATGTMVNQGNKSYTPSANMQAITEGYYKGGYIQGSVSSIPNNIRKDVIINGVTGTLTSGGFTAGDTILLSQLQENYGNFIQTATSPTIAMGSNKFTVNYGGTVRLKFGLRISSGTAQAGYGRIYKNGQPYGTTRSNNTTSHIQFSEDLDCNSGDYFQLYVWGVDGSTGMIAVENWIMSIGSSLTQATIS